MRIRKGIWLKEAGTGVAKPEPMREAVSQRSSFRFRSAATILRIR